MQGARLREVALLAYIGVLWSYSQAPQSVASVQVLAPGREIGIIVPTPKKETPQPDIEVLDKLPTAQSQYPLSRGGRLKYRAAGI